MGLPLRAHSSKRYFCTKYLVLKIYLGKSDGERQILAFKSHPSRSKREAATHGSQLFPKQQLRDALALRGRVEIIGQGRGQSTTKEQEAATGEVETPLWRFNGKDGGHKPCGRKESAMAVCGDAHSELVLAWCQFRGSGHLHHVDEQGGPQCWAGIVEFRICFRNE